MRVLITNNTLAARAGSELYVRDLALALLRRGHQPVAYSLVLGEVAEEMRRATVPVVSDLSAVAEPPDVIHGQHHLETMTALLHFPGVPAVSFCHGWLPWEERPARGPRVLRWVAVDDTCRDRLVAEEGIDPARVEVVRTFVDLARFRPREGPLPDRPSRALLFSNYAGEGTHLPAVREACATLGITLDVMGLASGRPVARPEDLLPAYDLVFAKGRAAFEALAVGAAVVVCDAQGLGGLVSPARFEELWRLNFGVRALSRPLDPRALAGEVAAYDPAEAREVTRRIRERADLERAADRLVSLYEEVRAEGAARAGVDPREEGRAAARYLAFLSPVVKAAHPAARERDLLRRETERLGAELGRLQEETDALRAEGEGLRGEWDALRGERALLLTERGALRQDAEALGRDRDAARAEAEASRAEAAAARAESAGLQGTLTWRARRALLAVPFLVRLYRAARRLPPP